jgi:hypothetical protein
LLVYGDKKSNGKLTKQDSQVQFTTLYEHLAVFL